MLVPARVDVACVLVVERARSRLCDTTLLYRIVNPNDSCVDIYVKLHPEMFELRLEFGNGIFPTPIFIIKSQDLFSVLINVHMSIIIIQTEVDFKCTRSDIGLDVSFPFHQKADFRAWNMGEIVNTLNYVARKTRGKNM